MFIEDLKVNIRNEFVLLWISFRIGWDESYLVFNWIYCVILLFILEIFILCSKIYFCGIFRNIMLSWIEVWCFIRWYLCVICIFVFFLLIFGIIFIKVRCCFRSILYVFGFNFFIFIRINDVVYFRCLCLRKRRYEGVKNVFFCFGLIVFYYVINLV